MQIAQTRKPRIACRIFLLLEHKQGLGLKTCSFKGQGVLDRSIFSWVFQHLVILGVDIEKLFWVSSFCPFFPDDLMSHLES
jgi:hypothetical protein